MRLHDVGWAGSTVEQGSTLNRSAQAEVAQLNIRDLDLVTVGAFSIDLVRAVPCRAGPVSSGSQLR